MTCNKNSHLTFSERQIIETGIYNNSSKSSIALILGKNKSTIGKEIKLHRTKVYSSTFSVDCSLFAKCKNKNFHSCNKNCANYSQFYCPRRDRSPGACNGCEKYNRCRYDKYRYSSSEAHHEYRESLVNSRLGVNATLNEIKQLGLTIKPLLEKGQSIYAILQNHPEIDLSEKSLYNYIENGVFQDAGISITCLDLKRQVRRKLSKKNKTQYSPRKDRSYLKGRTMKEFDIFLKDNPYTSIVEMDTVYNDVSNGPFLQTFKFLKYDLFICFYHEVKDADHMLEGILLLEEILGKELFNHEVQIIKTDRGSEFTMAEKAEIRSDGSRRTRLFYCDSMASFQKGSLENEHISVRDICPKDCNLYELGLTSQDKANLISSHLNSYPKEKLNGKTSFQLLSFLNPDMYKRLSDLGITEIPADNVTLKPYLLKNK